MQYYADQFGIMLDEEKARNVLLRIKEESIRRKGLLTPEEFKRIAEEMK